MKKMSYKNPPVFDSTSKLCDRYIEELNEIKLQDLNKDTSVKLLIKYFDSLFKQDELSEVYECYTKFDRYEKKDQDKMEDFISVEFEKLYNRITQKLMELPEVVPAF